MELISTDISLWRFPASAILAAAFILLLWAADRYYAPSRLCRMLTSMRTAILLILALITLITVEGIWAIGLYHTLPFIADMTLLTASLGLVTLRRLRVRRSAGFLLNHAGLFLILWGSLFGAPDIQQARIIVPVGGSEHLAYTSSGEIIPLPFDIRLERFAVDRYDDGTPRQFRSSVYIGDRRADIEVNSPLRHSGYTLHQDGYDTREERYTVLLVVRDPWLWIVWAGIALLAAGSLLMLFRK